VRRRLQGYAAGRKGADRTAQAEAAPRVPSPDRLRRPALQVGTSVGFLYVLREGDGSVLPGFPLQMGEIQGQASAAHDSGPRPRTCLLPRLPGSAGGVVAHGGACAVPR